MTTMTRTDIHRPSAPEFDPEAYDFFGCFDLFPQDAFDIPSPTRQEVVSGLVAQGWKFTSVHGSGQCGHCGARIRYGALMGHRETKGLIWVGETCLDNRFSLTKGEFATLRKNAALNAERRALAERRSAFLADHPDLVWASYAHNISVAGGVQVFLDHDWNEYPTAAEAQAAVLRQGGREGEYGVDFKRGTTWVEQTRMGDKVSTLQDMWFRFERYGDMSDKAYGYLSKIVGWMSEAEERRVARETEVAAKVERGATVTAGRQVIEGEVTTTRWDTNDYGTVQKMRVVNGDLAYWGSVPSSIEVEKGTRVRFTATVEPSNDDPSFGFFKRPAKAEVL